MRMVLYNCFETRTSDVLVICCAARCSWEIFSLRRFLSGTLEVFRSGDHGHLGTLRVSSKDERFPVVMVGK